MKFNPPSETRITLKAITESQATRRGLMRWIVESSLKYRFIAIAAAMTMMVLGSLQLPKMPVDVFPEFAPPRVEIQTMCNGLSTGDVESLVTVPLEQALTGIEGLQDLRSKSVPQLSDIQLIFAPGADLLKVRQLVQERLTNATVNLPTWASPPVMLPPLTRETDLTPILDRLDGVILTGGDDLDPKKMNLSPQRHHQP